MISSRLPFSEVALSPNERTGTPSSPPLSGGELMSLLPCQVGLEELEPMGNMGLLHISRLCLNLIQGAVLEFRNAPLHGCRDGFSEVG